MYYIANVRLKYILDNTICMNGVNLCVNGVFGFVFSTIFL
ncbi:protein of unknown function [Tenacibaculum aestuariivivum]